MVAAMMDVVVVAPGAEAEAEGRIPQLCVFLGCCLLCVFFFSVMFWAAVAAALTTSTEVSSLYLAFFLRSLFQFLIRRF